MTGAHDRRVMRRQGEVALVRCAGCRLTPWSVWDRGFVLGFYGARGQAEVAYSRALARGPRMLMAGAG